MNVFFHSGDLGDCIAFLPVIRQLGGGQLILGNRNGQQAREAITEERFNAIAPLLRAQPYISAVSHEHDAKGVTHDAGNFRSIPCRCGHEAHNLVNWHGDYFGISDVDVSPWLSGITPSEETKGRAVFARTLRYHGQNFDWPGIARQYPNAMFIGFADEYRGLCDTAKMKLAWKPTSNLLEVAELIAGSEMLVSNQCVASWIAMGMGHRLIQEVCHWSVNSIIRRDNAEFRY